MPPKSQIQTRVDEALGEEIRAVAVAYGARHGLRVIPTLLVRGS